MLLLILIFIDLGLPVLGTSSNRLTLTLKLTSVLGHMRVWASSVLKKLVTTLNYFTLYQYTCGCF